MTNVETPSNVDFKDRVLIKDLVSHVDKNVSVCGWLSVRRDQGKLIFVDIRDHTGSVQGVVLPESKSQEIAKTIRPEWVLAVVGKVHTRPERNQKKEILNGTLELEIEKIVVLNQAHTPAFEIDSDGKEINEEVRLEHRYLDLRRPRLQNTLKKRHEMMQCIRAFYTKNDFWEIDTPILTNPTPEGSRDFVVPSRLHPGNIYALPQSPQQYKQILMASGVPRYFQIARCFRDEDTRGDRQPEFTQIDMEMSFVTEEDVMRVNEALVLELVSVLYPNKKVSLSPIPRYTYAECMEKYKSDKPDIRVNKNNPDELAFCWVIKFPMFEKTDKGEWTFTHNPFSAPVTEHIEDVLQAKNIKDIIATQYDLVLNGYEIGGGSIRSHTKEMLVAVFHIMGYSDERIEKEFGHMLQALGSGTPPHGGFAFGFDRLLMILQGEPNIREVIPFAKTGEGRDVLMHAPAQPTVEQLIDAHITFKKNKIE
ncbi:MAG: OB-fold nucleic acid binding domain-containing protein [Alphaproteobacteria bacterium]|nr:OB-fold nucleic acid binding domain-containing protein [Alphaproteobacteria bacterium]